MQGENQRFSEYRLESRIGQGGMGTVYRARGPDGRLVAMKVLPPGEEKRASRTRFLFEVSCLRRLNHPRIVKVLDAGRIEGRPWLAMEYVDAPSLLDLVRRRRLAGHRGLPLSQVLRVFGELANALAVLELADILHRDIKPANVLVREDGQPILVDFGLARVADDPLHLTRTGALVGTLDFVAPEQVRELRSGREADFYSLGITLYVCLLGHLPFPGLSSYMRTVRRAEEDPPAPGTLRPDVPAGLDELSAELLRRDPDRRLADAGELALRLKELALCHDAASR